MVRFSDLILITMVIIIQAVILRLVRVLRQVGHQEFIELWDFIHFHYRCFPHHLKVIFFFIVQAKPFSFLLLFF